MGHLYNPTNIDPFESWNYPTRGTIVVSLCSHLGLRAGRCVNYVRFRSKYLGKDYYDHVKFHICSLIYYAIMHILHAVFYLGLMRVCKKKKKNLEQSTRIIVIYDLEKPQKIFEACPSWPRFSCLEAYLSLLTSKLNATSNLSTNTHTSYKFITTD